MSEPRPPRTPRVLIVEDDVFVQRVFVRHLRRRADLTIADGAVAARGLWREQRFDIVVCDMQLPDGDGLELLAEAARACPGARLVLCSGSAPAPVARCAPDGDRDVLFLHKPEGLDELVTLVDGWVEGGP
jgi:CheY-like chemotaxis protein